MTPSDPLLGKPRILIVDDEESLRKALVFDFKRAGFDVFDAENGEKAYQLLQTTPVDLVLTDVRMPICDGIQLLDRIKAENPRLPVVMFITGFTDLSPEDAYQKGAAAIFAKPFDRKQLMASVKRGLLSTSLKWAVGALPPNLPEIKLSVRSIEEAEKSQQLHIGQGGMFVAVDTFPTADIGTEVRFDIEIAEPSPIRFQGTGQVRWCRHETSATDGPKGLGVEFQFLTPESITWIERQIHAHTLPVFIPKS